MHTTMRNQSNYTGLDLGKLLFAYVVMANHASLFADQNQQLYTFFMNHISNIAVPFYFITSGFLMGRKTNLLDNDVDSISYCRTFLRRIIPPYIAWGVIYFILTTLSSHIVDKISYRQLIPDKIHELIIASPGGGMWYIYSLIFLVIVVMLSIKGHFGVLPLFLLFLDIYLLPALFEAPSTADSVIHTIRSDYFKIFIHTRNFMFYGVYYYAGMLFGVHEDTLKEKLSLGKCTVLLLGALLGQISFYTFVKQDDPREFLVGLLEAVLFLLWQAAIFLWFSRIRLPLSAVISQWIRKISTVVFFSHVSVILLIKIYLARLDLPYATRCTKAFLYTAAFTTAAALILIPLSKKWGFIKKVFPI